MVVEHVGAAMSLLLLSVAVAAVSSKVSVVVEQKGNPSQSDILKPVAPTQQYVAVVPCTTMAPGQLLTVTPLTTSVLPACRFRDVHFMSAIISTGNGVDERSAPTHDTFTSADRLSSKNGVDDSIRSSLSRVVF